MAKRVTISLEAPVEGINELSSIYKLPDKKAQTLKNVDIDSHIGTLSSRGLAQYLSDAGAIPSGNEIVALHFYEKTDGTYYLIATDGVRIYASLSGTGAWSLINSGNLLTASKPIPKFLNIDNSLWITNGFDSVAQWKDGTTYRLLNGAQTAGTGTVTTSGKTVTGSGTSFTSEYQVGYGIVVNGENRMVVSIASNTSMTVDTAFNNPVSGVAHLIQATPNVPKGEFFVFYQNKVVMGKLPSNSLSVRMSINVLNGVLLKPDYYNAWPETEELLAPAAYGAGLTGLAILQGLPTDQGMSQGRLLLFKDTSMHTLSGNNISNYQFDILSPSIGTRYSKSIEYLDDGSIVFAGELGIYKTNGDLPKRISDAVENTYLDLKRRRSYRQSQVFSQNFNGFTLTNTEVTSNTLRLSGSNLTGTAESANIQLCTRTAKEFLAAVIQKIESTGTITVELKCASTEVGLGAASYAEIEDAEIPGFALNTWGKLKITITRPSTSVTPMLTFVKVNYVEDEALVREPYSIYSSDEYLFGMDTEFDNIRLSLNRMGAWTIDQEDSILMSCGTRYRGVKYLGATNGRVYSLYAALGEDDTLNVSSEWKTKPITAGFPDRLKSLDYLVVFSEGIPFRRLFIDLTLDGVLRRTLEFVVSGESLRETKFWMPMGVIFKTLEITFRTSTEQQISKIGRIDLGIRVIENAPEES